MEEWKCLKTPLRKVLEEKLIFASFLSNCFSQPAIETQKPLEIAEPMTHISLNWTAFYMHFFMQKVHANSVRKKVIKVFNSNRIIFSLPFSYFNCC